MEFKIRLNNVRTYAYIGCMKEESLIGTEFTINIEVTTDNTSFHSDDINATVDYCKLYQIINEESKYRHHLIETLAYKILKRIQGINQVKSCRVEVNKINPPINGEVESVSVIFAS